MNVLVTGGTGFLGGAVARRFQELGWTTTITGRNRAKGEALSKLGIAFEALDLAELDSRGREALRKLCEAKDVVVHCAALASPWGPYEGFYRANVVATRHLLAACRSAGVRRFVHISTPSVYFDYQHRRDIRESDPLPEKHATAYAETKWQADLDVADAARAGLETISLRPRAIFGPGDTSVLGRAMRAAKNGRVPLVDGGRSFIDMTYIDNAVDAVVLAANAPASLSGRVYNITNGEPKPIQEVFDLLFEKLQWKIRYLRLPFVIAHFVARVVEWVVPRFTGKEPPITRYAIGLMSKSQTLDIRAAREDLGYAPSVSLAQGFERYASWWNREARNYA